MYYILFTIINLSILTIISAEANEEMKMQINVASQDVFVFPASDKIDEHIPIPEVEQRIKDILLVLSNFNKFREENR